MIGDIFTLLLLNPLVNLLVLLSHVLWGSFGLAIIAFTILVRVATFPLTLRQLHATRAMQALQPRVQEINKKYSDPKRRQEEMMKLYREGGANPLSCLGPILLTFPVFIALYSAIRIALPNSPKRSKSSRATSTAGATSSTPSRSRNISSGSTCVETAAIA